MFLLQETFVVITGKSHFFVVDRVSKSFPNSVFQLLVVNSDLNPIPSAMLQHHRIVPAFSCNAYFHLVNL